MIHLYHECRKCGRTVAEGSACPICYCHGCGAEVLPSAGGLCATCDEADIALAEGDREALVARLAVVVQQVEAARGTCRRCAGHGLIESAENSINGKQDVRPCVCNDGAFGGTAPAPDVKEGVLAYYKPGSVTPNEYHAKKVQALARSRGARMSTDKFSDLYAIERGWSPARAKAELAEFVKRGILKVVRPEDAPVQAGLLVEG